MRIGAEAGRASFGAALRCSVAAALMAAGCMQPLAAARAAPAPSAFAAFVSGLWPEAERVGIPRATFDAAFATLTPDPSLAPLIRAQPEFSKPIGTYLAAQVTPARIAAGHSALARWHAALDGIAVRTGVPPAIVVAVWGLETNYGAAAGSKDVIRSLATLGALGWRPELMRSELVAALTLIKDGDATRAQLRGSWAGAMGQPQFMPSSFAKYAVDGDGDGRRDIWTDVPDALASIANFLKQQGWQAGQPWGFEVRLPPGFDVGQSHGSFADWAARGLARPDGGAFPAQGDATLFFPAGARRPGLPGDRQLPRHQDLQLLRRLCAERRHAGRPHRRRPRDRGLVAQHPGPGQERAHRAPGPGSRPRATPSTTARAASASRSATRSGPRSARRGSCRMGTRMRRCCGRWVGAGEGKSLAL